MPVLQCPDPDCGCVVAWRGKALTTSCLGSVHGDYRVPLDVDETLATGLNGDGIEAHLPGHDRPERAHIRTGTR